MESTHLAKQKSRKQGFHARILFLEKQKTKHALCQNIAQKSTPNKGLDTKINFSATTFTAGTVLSDRILRLTFGSGQI